MLIIITIVLRCLFIRISKSHLIGMRKSIMLEADVKRIKYTVTNKQEAKVAIQNLYFKNDLNTITSIIVFIIQIIVIGMAVYTFKNTDSLEMVGQFMWISDLTKSDSLMILPIILASLILGLTYISNNVIKGVRSFKQPLLFAFLMGGISIFLPSWLIIFVFVNVLFQIILIMLSRQDLTKVQINA